MMEVHIMKKYNTPEIMISMFNREEVVTAEATTSTNIINDENAKGNMVVQINAQAINVEW